MDKKKTQKIHAAEPDIYIVFVLCILLPCQNLLSTLPTMQLDFQQLGLGFGCVVLVAANVALDGERAAEVWYVYFKALRVGVKLCNGPNLNDWGNICSLNFYFSLLILTFKYTIKNKRMFPSLKKTFITEHLLGYYHV